MRAGAVVFGVAFGLVSVWLATRPTGLSFAAASEANTVVELAAGWSVIAVGFTTWIRSPEKRLGPLLTAAGLTWFLVGWTNPGTASPLAFTMGLVLSAASMPLVAHAILAFPGGRLDQFAERSAICAAYATNLLLIGLLPTLLYAPSAVGCSVCPTNLLELRSEPDLAAAIGRIGLIGAAIWVALVVLLVGRKLLRATVPARRVSLPVVAPGLAFLVLFAVTALHDLPGGVLGIDDEDTLLWQGEAIALVMLAVGVASEWVRTQRTRARVAGLVVELAESPRAGGLRDKLSVLLDDPDLVLAYPIGNDRYVDDQGRSVALDSGDTRLLTPLVRDGGEVAMLGHRRGLEDDPAQMNELVRTARLTLENERLQAVTRARLAELRTSRARVVEASDEERRHLERDLHDGAQQRVVSLLIALRLLRTRLDPDSGAIMALDQAEAELRGAVADLRQVAHGIYPAILADEGLADGVEALMEGSTTHMTIDAMPRERFDLPIEAAAYFLIAEATTSGAARRARINVRHVDASLMVEVEHDGKEPESVTELEDRIGALDGTVMVDKIDGGLIWIRAEIPCGS